MFDKLIWKTDRLLLDDLVFRLELGKSGEWDLGDECFIFYKDKTLVDQYSQFFTSRPEFQARNILELGIYDGGSLAFWAEYFHPVKHIGVDNLDRQDTMYFRKYLDSRNLDESVKTYWRVDQGDANRLKDIVRSEYSRSLDLVIDDASHQYLLTKSSFETLFPLLRPGGLYIIEDWAWSHWPAWQAADHPWANNIELTRLVFDIVEIAGTSRDFISNLTVFQGFTVVERGPAVLDPNNTFRLDDHILRRSK